jgi:hypothetical protein
MQTTDAERIDVILEFQSFPIGVLVRKMMCSSDWTVVRKMMYISDMTGQDNHGTDLKTRLLARIESTAASVWTPADFADIGGRAAVDKALQRLAASGDLRRIDRGLYDRPRLNSLTGQSTVPDYRAIIEAVSRRDNSRVLVDGMTAANDLGLTTAVPAQIEVLIDARLRAIHLGNQIIRFKTVAPSRLYWAGRPAMRVVQALYWLQDMLSNPEERRRVADRLHTIFADPVHGLGIRDDLRSGMSALPIWMQEFVRDLMDDRSRPQKDKLKNERRIQDLHHRA